MGKLSHLEKGIKSVVKQLDSVANQGYTSKWYHGTAGDVRPDQIDFGKLGSVTESEAAKQGFMLHSSPDVARQFADHAAQKTGLPPRVDEFYYRPIQELSFDWPSTAGVPARSEPGQITQAVILDDLKSQGVGAAVIRNTDDAMESGHIGDVLVSMDGRGLRYSDADFDPDKKDSPNLFASVGGAALLGSAALTGATAPGHAQASDVLADFAQRRAAKKDKWKSVRDIYKAGMEVMAGINRGAVDTLNFLGPDQVNAVLQLSGSEKSIPTFSDIPGVNQATEGYFMEPGAARDVVRAGSEFLSPL